MKIPSPGFDSNLNLITEIDINNHEGMIVLWLWHWSGNPRIRGLVFSGWSMVDHVVLFV